MYSKSELFMTKESRDYSKLMSAANMYQFISFVRNFLLLEIAFYLLILLFVLLDENLVTKRINVTLIMKEDCLSTQTSTLFQPFSQHTSYVPGEETGHLINNRFFSHLLCSIREIHFCVYKSFPVSHMKENNISFKYVKNINQWLLFSFL